MKRRRVAFLFASCGAVVALVLLGGCATIVNGRTQIVSVRSSPPGATVKVQSIGDEDAAKSWSRTYAPGWTPTA